MTRRYYRFINYGCSIVTLNAPKAPLKPLFARGIANQSIDQKEESNHETNHQTHDISHKLIYEGKLKSRILSLKAVSLSTSVGLSASYIYILNEKGFSAVLAGVGFAFTPFLLSPIIIAWFFKRYITHLYYNHQDETYKAHHFGWFLGTKEVTFRREDVARSETTSILNTFTVNKRPFFLHDEDLVDVESIEIYKKMIGLEEVKKENT